MVQRAPRVQRPLAAAVLGAAFLLAGCQYLLGLAPLPPGDPSGSFAPFPLESFALPSPLATYRSGSATVEIDGETLSLDRLAGTAATYGSFPTEATWTDGKGMYLRLFGGSGLDDFWFVTLDRVQDGTHWVTMDPSVCSITVSRADREGLDGVASCKDLRWTDAITGAGAGMPIPIESEAPFDAEITFTATP